MPAPDPLEKRPSGGNIVDVTRSVSEDLNAIFGAGTRAFEDLPPNARRLARVGLLRRRQAVVVVMGGVLTTVVAAGIYFATGGTDNFTSARTSITDDHTSKRLEVSSVRPMPTTPVFFVRTEPPVRKSVDAPTPVLTAGPAYGRSRTTGQSSATSLPSSPSSLVAVETRPTRADSSELSVGVPVTVRQQGYIDDSDEGDASRVELAEQRLTIAYDQAVVAGVRPAILRGYRREWERARHEVAERPQVALRLYAMITSDFYNLADDPAVGGGRFRR